MSTKLKPQFHINGTSTKVLRYARFAKKEITPEQVRNFFPHFFKRPYRARETMQRLEARELLASVGPDSWKITAQGINYLYTSAPRYQGELK